MLPVNLGCHRLLRSLGPGASRGVRARPPSTLPQRGAPGCSAPRSGRRRSDGGQLAVIDGPRRIVVGRPSTEVAPARGCVRSGCCYHHITLRRLNLFPPAASKSACQPHHTSLCPHHCCSVTRRPRCSAGLGSPILSELLGRHCRGAARVRLSELESTGCTLHGARR